MRPQEGHSGEDALRQGSWSGEYPKIEVKSNTAVTVAPSVHHETGRRYQWVGDGPGAPLEGSEALLEARSSLFMEQGIAQRTLWHYQDAEGKRRAAEVDRARIIAQVPERPGQLLGDFLAAAPEAPEFEIPGLVPRQSRVIITGEEGAGKTTVARFVAASHAAGIHPFTGEPYGGGVSVLLDCENPLGLQQMRLAELAESLGGDAAQLRSRLVVAPAPGGIDLASPYWQEWLARLVGTWKATMVFPTPLYKLCAAHKPMSEEFFTTVSQFFDRLRAEHGCALWLEAHCRQLSPGQFTRDIFPYGNTGWRRWPETGVHLSKGGLLTDWRGDRYGSDVRWPARLARVPGSQVLWQAEYGGPAPAAGPEMAAEKIRVIRAAIEETPGISLAKLRLAVGDDGTWISRALEAGAITVHKGGPGRPNRYTVTPGWTGPQPYSGGYNFQALYEAADHGDEAG